MSNQHMDYWQAQLEKPVTPIDLPIDYSRPSIFTYQEEQFQTKITIDLQVPSHMGSTSKEEKIHAYLLAAFLLWTHNSCNEVDLFIGHADAHSRNIIPFRFQMATSETLSSLLERVQKQCTDMEIQRYSNGLDPHLHDLIAHKDPGRPLYPVGFHYGSIVSPAIDFVETDIHWQVEYRNGLLSIHVTYNATLFNRESINRFIQQYEKLLDSMNLADNHSLISELKMMTEKEKNLYKRLNETALDYPKDASIADLFIATVRRFPERIALSTDSAQLTYSELNEKSDAIAHMLLAKGLQKGNFVSILMERSLETIISIVGVLKAGGAYVPIDPTYPEERCAYLLNDTDSKFILTKRTYSDLLKNMITSPVSNPYIHFMDEPLTEYPDSTVSINVTPDDIAYVIYTSGSTGKPKGTLLTHRNVTNLVASLFDIYGCTKEDVYTQFFSFSFDPSVAETFMTLFSGARLHLLTELERISIEDFAVAVERIQATGIILPTAFFNQLAMHLPSSEGYRFQSVKNISMGGEALIGSMVRNWQSKVGTDMDVLNLYGPTECTVISTMGRVSGALPEEQSTIPIGHPIGNYEAYILNSYNQLSPVNVPGELCIGGIGLAEGYWKRPEKTTEVFIPHPFSNSIGERIYRTGDMVRLLPGGEIEFIGRKDSQVKVRGFRIEIGEIEDVLARHAQISETVIIPKKGTDNNNTLHAFFTCTQGTIKEEQIRGFLSKHLPEYMVPSSFVQLEEMPLAPTGKVDRKKLEETEQIMSIQTKKIYKQAETDIQHILTEAWEHTLGITQIGIDDDFFHIGGHSLKILQILVQVKKHFPFLKIQDFYQYRTIEEMEQYILISEPVTPAPTSEEQTHWEMKDLIEPPAIVYNMDDFQDAHINSILLTGATGYLGSHLLFELLNTTDSTIYCTVRPKKGISGMNRIRNQLNFYFGSDISESFFDRIIPVHADLGEEGLGMDNAIRLEILSNIGSIIHCGADVRHFGEAAHFESVNVRGTTQLIELAMQKNGIQFHHISTIGIPEELAHSGQWNHYQQTGDFDYTVTLDNVYTQSKLQAEEAVRQAGMKNNIPVNIYRVGNLSCHSTKGYFQQNMDENAFYRMIKAMLFLKKAPNVHWFIDIAPVDYVSKAIIGIIENQNHMGETFHLCNPVQIRHSDFIRSLQQMGYEIETMELADYEQWLLNGEHKKEMRPYLELAISQLEGEGAKNSEIRFCAPRTKQAAQNIGINCALPDQALIQILIDYGAKSGYFPVARIPAHV
ncbi:amino acid adenylation domain-containing protein [Bacillus sp. 1P06AnD]|uniref:non-ribosomal peptide synthetase family protein n=1 Tax=Bacillus sp. 1P06AnD TaxID=3132208 RepID=UPI0039A295EB